MKVELAHVQISELDTTIIIFMLEGMHWPFFRRLSHPSNSKKSPARIEDGQLNALKGQRVMETAGM